MDKNTRVTRAEAARIAGVHPRTISRWSAAGRLHPDYRLEGGTHVTAWYDVAEVKAVAAGPGRRIRATTEGS